MTPKYVKRKWPKDPTENIVDFSYWTLKESIQKKGRALWLGSSAFCNNVLKKSSLVGFLRLPKANIFEVKWNYVPMNGGCDHLWGRCSVRPSCCAGDLRNARKRIWIKIHGVLYFRSRWPANNWWECKKKVKVFFVKKNERKSVGGRVFLLSSNKTWNSVWIILDTAKEDLWP